jgi:hypothetical protein
MVVKYHKDKEMANHSYLPLLPSKGIDSLSIEDNDSQKTSTFIYQD